MSALTLPYGGREIAALRSAGKRPADLVLFSLVGPLCEPDNPTVIGQINRQYDLRFLAGLDVLIVPKLTQPTPAIRALIDAVKAVRPNYLGLWFADRQNGINVIVGGVTAQPHGLLRYMDATDHQNFSGICPKEYFQCV